MALRDLLDTNVVSELTKPAPNPGVLHDLVYAVEAAEAFADFEWNWAKLADKPVGAGTGLPFVVSLPRLLAARAAPLRGGHP